MGGWVAGWSFVNTKSIHIILNSIPYGLQCLYVECIQLFEAKTFALGKVVIHAHTATWKLVNCVGYFPLHHTH